MTTPRYSTTGEVTIAIRKHIKRTTGEVNMRTGFSKDFRNYVTTINPMRGTAMTVDQIAQDAQGWDGKIEVTKTSVRITTVHLVDEPAELESEPVLDDVDHLDEGDGRPLADQLGDVLALDTPAEEDTADETPTSTSTTPETTRARTNQINAAAHPHAGVTNGRRTTNASVHTLVSRVDEVDQVVAAVLQLGWAGMGAEVDEGTTRFMGQDDAGVKIRVRVPDLDEAGQPLCRFDETPANEVPTPEVPATETVDAVELPPLLEQIRIDVPEGYRLATRSNKGVWLLDLWRLTADDEVHAGSRERVAQADVQAVVDEMVRLADEAHVAELLAEVADYQASQVDEPVAVAAEIVHPSDDADQQQDEDLDEELVDDELDDELVQDQEKIDNADRDAVFGLPLEPDYVPDPTQGLPVLGVDHVVTVDELVPGRVVERIVHANANKVRTLAPCCGRYVLLPVTAGLYAPVACGWSCKTQYLVTRLYTDAQRVDSIARFVVLGQVLVVSQYYPGRGKKAS